MKKIKEKRARTALLSNWFYVFQGNNPLEYVLSARRRHHTTVICALRLVYDNKNKILRLTCREKAHKGRYILADGDMTVGKSLRRPY